ncbi:MAG: succinate dehydrogenase iron-sulfur subunit [Acidobacteria bacterium]|nr:MAG: succinate dehydrogenase iron-sulfur subunit [Acidobacteriota bacterium]
MAESNKIVNFHVTRYNPEKDVKPYIQTYKVEVTDGMTVLDGLHWIKEHLDPTLVWRYSCRMGICGSCGMLINGSPTLACNTQISHLGGMDITVGPLPNFEIIRDLVPDLASMFDKHASVKPNIIRDEADLVSRQGEFYQSPEQLEEFLQFTFCIKCGCCMAACPTLATDVRYLGPMPLTALQRYNTDTRDEGFDIRAKIAGGDGGAFSCHYAGECSRVCPKGVDPAKAIQLLKRKLVLDYLHLASKKQPCKKLEGPGHGKLLPNMNPPARTVVQDAPAETNK